MPTTTPIDELARPAGSELGVSDFVSISQDKVDAFAEVTGGKPVCVATAIYRVYE